ncbi:MAG: MtnX-like HAD-IB family phosphatase [Candidatus Delongbacteria bacterium]|nr:MtnX-like HAD-IB family phosphatase [Candidatus Delongbacteria bacterium]
MDPRQLLEQHQVEVFLDFDGTITEVDTLVLLLDRFAPPSWWDIENEVLAGGLNEKESLQREMDCIRVDWETARAFLLQEARLRPGFRELIDWLRQREIPVTVLSGGFRRNIETVFTREGIDLPVCANEAEVTGERWRVIPAPHPRLRDRCNHCKSWHLEQARSRGSKIIYLGDGTTDRCASGVADFVFARDNLLSWCREQGINHLSFTDFHGVLQALRDEEG